MNVTEMSNQKRLHNILHEVKVILVTGSPEDKLAALEVLRDAVRLADETTPHR